MRITDTAASRNFLASINQQRAALDRASNEISSGRKLLRPSDDPQGSEKSVLLRSQLARNEQYRTSAVQGQSRLEQTDSLIDSFQLLMDKARELTTQGLSGSTTPTTRAVLAESIDGLIEQVASIANTSVRGEYLFAGTASNTRPFGRTGETVTYQGNNEPLFTRVADGTLVQTNVTGAELFQGGADAFATLANIKQALTDNDTTGLQQGLAQIKAIQENSNLVRGEVGATLNHLQNRISQLAREDVNLTAEKSNVEDANLVDAIVRSNQTQTSLQASLNANARVLKMSLIDFLR